jgi:putative phosphoesterase
VRVAALYDVHGNLPALEAVLAELDELGPDVVLFGGDVLSGALPRQTCERVRAVANARFVMGNADRYLIEGKEDSPLFGWSARQLDDEHLDFLRTFEQRVVIDDVLYCHAAPSADEPFVTILTPDPVAREIVGEVEERMLVIGHTHAQFDRRVGDLRLVNAGSVGMPYEDRPGAYWLLVDGGEPAFRHTEYDLEAAAERIRAGGWPEAETWIAENLLTVPSAREAAEFFESQRG